MSHSSSADTTGDNSETRPASRGRGPATIFWLIVFGLVSLAVYRDFALAAGILVFLTALTIHESGHFAMAMLMGIPIRRFRIGIGPTIGKLQIGSTSYELGLVPLMGFVQPYVMRPSELIRFHADRSGRDDPAPAPALTPEDEVARPTTELVSRPRQLLFMVGGVGFNLLAALICFGLVGGKSALAKVPGMTTTIMSQTPEAIAESFKPSNYARYEPGTVAVIGSAAKQGWRPLMLFFAIFNLVLFCFNLIPIPPLDGYRIVRLSVEMALRRALPQAWVLPFELLGLVFLLLLLVTGAYFLVRDVLMSAFR